MEKEVDIRRRVLRDFNKKEEDFPSLREYNDYLEEVETIIFNLVNNIDQLETNKKIEKFKKENRELILKNKVRVCIFNFLLLCPYYSFLRPIF